MILWVIMSESDHIKIKITIYLLHLYAWLGLKLLKLVLARGVYIYGRVNSVLCWYINCMNVYTCVWEVG